MFVTVCYLIKRRWLCCECKLCRYTEQTHVPVSAVTRVPSAQRSISGLLLSNYGHWFSLPSQRTSVWQLAFVSGLAGLLTAALRGRTICSKMWTISHAAPAPSPPGEQENSLKRAQPVVQTSALYRLFLCLLPWKPNSARTKFWRHLQCKSVKCSRAPPKNFPPTSTHTSRQRLFREASPSAVHRILFSAQSKRRSDWYVWQSEAVIDLRTVCKAAAFMHRRCFFFFLFHSGNIFWNWQRAPEEAESQSKHITHTVSVEPGSHELYLSCSAQS